MSAFRDAVAAATQGTPYCVVTTQKGFDVQLDIVNAQWWDLYNRAGLRKSFRWRVTERKSSFTITDRQINVAWRGGVPGFGATMEVQGGRIFSFSRQKIWAISDHGRVQPVVDYRFNSREGRDLIRLVARQQGLKERQPLILQLTAAFILVTPIFFAGYGIIRLFLWIAGIQN
ncbi:hypothetical protein FR943_24710 [Mycobacterium sp. TNTM28]|uniref:Uncharacterized protein n=1 Tax=[Mycobacterium] fortunisiensis TaxID=2600579 RepID=A0ABS6KTQ0_9MYCO|nr:hypothetical protein [[Mycobacterium] fortunisiensis]MBU9767025.1 hypothetical protein [[Mycobacterium] fortunisiensis]